MSVAKLLGHGPTLEYGGKVYTLRPLDVDRLGRFSAWVEGQQWQSHRRSRRYVPEAEYDANSLKINQVLAVGWADYPGPGFVAAFNSVPGLRYATYLALEDQGVDEELASKIVDGSVEKIMRAMAEANAVTSADPQTGTPDPVPPATSHSAT